MKAASPWMRSGIIAVVGALDCPFAPAFAAASRSCLARVRPSTTGFTNSRWLGLNVSVRCTLAPPRVLRSVE